MTTPSELQTQAVSAPHEPSPPPRALRRALALGLYFSILLLVSGLLVSRQVAAELNEKSLSLGRKLDAFQELSGRVTELSWNGQQLALSTLVVEQPVERVLARFVALCEANTGNLGRELASSVGAGEAAASLFQRLLVLRDLFDDGTGSAVCLAGLGEGGLSGLLDRARRFTASWDLSELGQLRYARLRKVGEASTQVLLVSADGVLRLDELLPVDGRDAKGEDVVPGARPAESTRVLAARAKGTPHGITAYLSRLSARDALVDYGRQLRDKGYTRAVAPAKAQEAPLARDAAQVLSEAYRRGSEALVITSQDHEDGSLLSAVQLAALPIPHPGEAPELGRALRGRGGLGGARDRAFE